MSALKELRNIQQKQKSMICLGLDLDPKRMPGECTGSTKAMFDFVYNVIEATKDVVCCYKPNLAFYENLGQDGISLLKLIVERIPDEIPVILDGKRGDIGNTAAHYAEFLFEKLGADWVTLNPYMGYDSMRPFFEYKDKGFFVLCLTSNPGSRDFQLLECDGKPLYRIVAEKVAYWNKDNNSGLVIGATHPEQLDEIRAVAGDMPLLIPGVGAQGGALESAVLSGTDNFKKVAVINVSRSVLYASNGKDYAERARAELIKLNTVVDSCRTSESPDDQTQKQQGSPQQNRPPEQQQQHNRYNNRPNNYRNNRNPNQDRQQRQDNRQNNRGDNRPDNRQPNPGPQQHNQQQRQDNRPDQQRPTPQPPQQPQQQPQEQPQRQDNRPDQQRPTPQPPQQPQLQPQEQQQRQDNRPDQPRSIPQPPQQPQQQPQQVQRDHRPDQPPSPPRQGGEPASGQ